MPTAVASAGTVSGEEVLALAEEQINVGKRRGSGGDYSNSAFHSRKHRWKRRSIRTKSTRVCFDGQLPILITYNYIRNVDWTDKTIEITETTEEPVVH